MTDYRTVLERDLDRVGPAPFGFDDVARRRDRKRRNQRISAGVVGIAVFVSAIWIATTGGPFDRTQTPAVTGPTVPRATGVPSVNYVIDLNTGVMTPLPEAILRPLGERSWASGGYAASPDGSLLAFVGGLLNDADPQMFIAGIDGTGVRQVTNDPNGVSSPAWSPDGTRIAYEGYGRRVGRSLFVLDVASGESTQIEITGTTPGQFRWGGTQFTPDGSSLLYTGGGDSQPVLQSVPVAGGESTLLFRPSGDLTGAANGSLSPDGSLVTFLGSQIGRPDPQRWVANADGTERRLLPDVYGIPCESNPAGTWSPDGSRIVCREASRIIVIDIATGGASPVAVGRGAIWLDDHTLLVAV